jgi:hypothetical protein
MNTKKLLRTKTVVITWELRDETALPKKPRLALPPDPKAIQNWLAFYIKAMSISVNKISGRI